MMQAFRADTCQNRHGGDLVVSQGSSLDRITLRDWQGSAGNHLDIVLDDTPAPVVPQSGALFFTGDQRAKLIGIETRLDLGPANVRDGTDAWTGSSLTPNATLTGDVAQAGFVDDLPGTSVSIAAHGHRAYIAGLFGFKFGAFEAQKRCWRWRWGGPDTRTKPAPPMWHQAHTGLGMHLRTAAGMTAGADPQAANRTNRRAAP
jgi:hypothetical protein